MRDGINTQLSIILGLDSFALCCLTPFSTIFPPQARFCQKSLYCYISNQRQLSGRYSLLEIAASCFSCSFFVVVDGFFFCIDF
jgi:hypothetical protein